MIVSVKDKERTAKSILAEIERIDATKLKESRGYRPSFLFLHNITWECHSQACTATNKCHRLTLPCVHKKTSIRKPQFMLAQLNFRCKCADTELIKVQRSWNDPN